MALVKFLRLIAGIPSQEVIKHSEIDEIGTRTHAQIDTSLDYLEEHEPRTHGAGIYSGGLITDAGGGTINVSGGNAWFRISNSDVADLVYLPFTGITGTSIASNTLRYVGIEYNAGSPQVVLHANYDWNFNTDFPIGQAYNNTTEVHVSDTPTRVNNFPTLVNRRIKDTAPIERSLRDGGIILGETGTRNITVTTGYFWSSYQKTSYAAIDTSISGSFDAYYRDGIGGFTQVTAQTQWDNDSWDDGTGVLATLTNNRYGVLWFYAELDNELVCVYGRGNHVKLTDAEAEAVPNTLPGRIQITDHAILIGRLIFLKSDTTATSIESAFTQRFSTAGITSHLDLTDIGTNTHTQIDTHIANTSNPHSVTIAQVSPLTTKGDLLAYSTLSNRFPVGTDGFVLSADSTQPFGIKWSASGASGEVNTASNVGVGGVGLFKQKVGVDLEFRNINTTSSRISVTLDGVNNEVDLDAVEANFTLDNIGGTLGIAKGGTGQTTASAAIGALSPLTTAGDLLTYAGGVHTRLGIGAAATILTSSGTAPLWTTATYPATTTINRILYSSATNTISEIASGATSALVTNSSSVPSFVSGTTANRLLRTDGTTVSFSQAVLTTDVTGILPVANGGTGLSSFTAGSVIFMDGAVLAQDNANFFWDDTNNRLGIGTATPGSPLSLVHTSTDTSGTITSLSVSKSIAPGSASTATQVIHDVVGSTPSTTFNKANSIQVGRYLFSRGSTDSGNIVSLNGLTVQTLNQAIFGTTTGSFGSMNTLTVQASDNSSTTTATTTMQGLALSTSIGTSVSASRVYTDLNGGAIALNINAAGGTTITTGRVLRLSPATSNQGGTITNAIALDVEAWTTTAGTGAGLTFTNPPEQIRLRSMTAASAMAIRQQGTATNRFEGNVMIGADSAPSYPLHVYKSTGISESVVQSGTVISTIRANTAGSGSILLGTISAHNITFIANSVGFIRLDNGFYTSLLQDMVPSGTIDVGRAALPFSTMHAENFAINNGVGAEITHGAGTISSSYTINWPGSQGAAGTFPKNDGSGNLTWTAGAVAADTWVFCGAVNGVAGAATSVAGISDTTNDSGVNMATAGTVKYITIVMDNARTAGTCIGKWLKNGVVQSGTVTIDGTNTTSHRNTAVNVAYAAGDILRLQTVTSSFTPTGADCTVTIFCKDT